MKKERSIKRPGRKRRAAGWTLIALGLLVAGVWVWSGWSYAPARVNSSTWMLGLHVRTGTLQLSVATNAGPLAPGYSVRAMRWREDARPEWEMWNWYAGEKPLKPGTLRAVGMPFWPIPLLLWSAGVPVLRSGILARRRTNTEQCGKCGYSLAGLDPSAPCPECGKPG